MIDAEGRLTSPLREAIRERDTQYFDETTRVKPGRHITRAKDNLMSTNKPNPYRSPEPTSEDEARIFARRILDRAVEHTMAQVNAGKLSVQEASLIMQEITRQQHGTMTTEEWIRLRESPDYAKVESRMRAIPSRIAACPSGRQGLRRRQAHSG
jgi:hypothetical protein